MNNIELNQKQEVGGKSSYPLVDYDITEAQALELCYDNGFDFNGIYENYSRLNCWCCPLQRIGELRNLFKNYPDKWEKLKEMQDDSKFTFRTDYTVHELEEKFVREINEK